MHHDCPVAENQVITTHIYVVLGLLKEIIVDPKLSRLQTCRQHNCSKTQCFVLHQVYRKDR